MTTTPKLSDMFACRTCETQIQVMKGCECDSACADFSCCGKPMKNITEPAVRTADSESVNETEKSVELPEPSMAEQAEQAKKI